MLNEDSGPTRRATLKYGSALAATLGLAGCATLSGEQGGQAETATETTATETEMEGPYTVEMAPVGGVTFESVPERWAAFDGGFGDMAVALGQGDGLTGVGGADRFYTYVYDELPGVSVDQEAFDAYSEVRTKEEFYELDSDIHFYDPQMLINWFDWTEADIEEIRENVAPFFANLIFRRSDEWHDYQYYTLYEAFEKVAQVFKQEAKYEAFAALHDEFIASIQDRLPPEDERPTVFLTFEATDEPSTFSPYRLDDNGTSKKQWRDLGVNDVLADTDVDQLSSTDRGELDYENLLELDPDVLLVRGHERKTAAEFRDVVLAYMADHPVGSELTAVQNGQVYRGGYLHQGPIHNLFLTERAAKQVFPEEFGEVTSDNQLFDRQRVADIVTGASV